MKKLAVIGANSFQNPLIEKAKALGFETHVFAWAAGDVGERTADVFHPISITEKEAIWQVCRQVGVEACCSIGSDLAVHTVNYVQRRLGRPCNPEITDTIATNKYAMRRALTDAGVACPQFMMVTDTPPAGRPGQYGLAGHRQTHGPLRQPGRLQGGGLRLSRRRCAAGQGAVL